MKCKPLLDQGDMRATRVVGRACRRGGRGTYLLVLHLTRKRTIVVGTIGRVMFRSGFYVYAGSAMGGLAARLVRHRRTRKPCHWHIDYLRRRARFRGAVAIVSAARLECRLAARVRQIAGRDVPGFGCSDCECRSHLFWFVRDPLRDSRLRKVLRTLGGSAYLVSSNPASGRASEFGPTHTRNSPGSTVGR